MKRGVASRILGVDVGALGHEHLAQVEVAVLRGDVQGGVAVLVVFLVRGGLREIVLRLVRVVTVGRQRGGRTGRFVDVGESYREFNMSGWRGGEQLTSWPLDRMADTSSILFHRTAECSSMRASCSGFTVEARGKGVRFDRELQGVGGYRGNSRDRDRSNARVRRGDYSPAASRTLTAPFVGSASAGFELRHPIATRALVSCAPARWVSRIEDSFINTAKSGSSGGRASEPAKTKHSTLRHNPARAQMNLMLRQTMGAIFARR